MSSSPTPDPRAARPRFGARWFALGFAIALVLAILAVTLRRPTSPAPPAAPGSLAAPATSEAAPLPPLAGAIDPATGEQVTPFQGFAVRVETEPPGALVAVAGQERGEAPVFAGVDCRPGDSVQVHARKGAARAGATIACRADALITLTLRLRR